MRNCIITGRWKKSLFIGLPSKCLLVFPSFSCAVVSDRHVGIIVLLIKSVWHLEPRRKMHVSHCIYWQGLIKMIEYLLYPATEVIWSAVTCKPWNVHTVAINKQTNKHLFKWREKTNCKTAAENIESGRIQQQTDWMRHVWLKGAAPHRHDTPWLQPRGV